MKALVIYDATGRIWSIVYGEEQAPQGLLSMFVDIPDGAALEKIDVTNPDEPKAVFSYLPESDIGKLQIRVTELENQLTEAQLALTEQYEANLALEDEVTNTQLALTELYEATQTTTTTKEA
jgi:hypothetical protein